MMGDRGQNVHQGMFAKGNLQDHHSFFKHGPVSHKPVNLEDNTKCYSNVILPPQRRLSGPDLVSPK